MIPKKHEYFIVFSLATLTLAAYLGNLRFENTFSLTIQVICGSIFILFIPGYYCALSFFKKDEIDVIEKIALSFALSISIVPLISFYLNLAGLPIHFFSIFIIVVAIILLNIAYQVFFYKKRGNKA